MTGHNNLEHDIPEDLSEYNIENAIESKTFTTEKRTETGWTILCY